MGAMRALRRRLDLGCGRIGGCTFGEKGWLGAPMVRMAWGRAGGGAACLDGGLLATKREGDWPTGHATVAGSAERSGGRSRGGRRRAAVGGGRQFGGQCGGWINVGRCAELCGVNGVWGSGLAG